MSDRHTLPDQDWTGRPDPALHLLAAEDEAWKLYHGRCDAPPAMREHWAYISDLIIELRTRADWPTPR